MLSLILLATCLQAQTEVAGQMSGVWRPHGSPYVVTENVHVAAQQHLTIQAGVTVLFYPGTSLEVHGELSVEGTVQNPTHFRCFDVDTTWNGVYLYANRSEYDFHEIFGAIITDCQMGIVTGRDANLSLVNSSVTALEGPISGDYCVLEVENCQFEGARPVYLEYSAITASNSLFHTGTNDLTGLFGIYSLLELSNCIVYGSIGFDTGCVMRVRDCQFLVDENDCPVLVEIKGPGSELIDCYIEGDVDFRGYQDVPSYFSGCEITGGLEIWNYTGEISDLRVLNDHTEIRESNFSLRNSSFETLQVIQAGGESPVLISDCSMYKLYLWYSTLVEIQKNIIFNTIHLSDNANVNFTNNTIVQDVRADYLISALNIEENEVFFRNNIFYSTNQGNLYRTRRNPCYFPDFQFGMTKPSLVRYHESETLR